MLRTILAHGIWQSSWKSGKQRIALSAKSISCLSRIKGGMSASQMRILIRLRQLLQTPVCQMILKKTWINSDNILLPTLQTENQRIKRFKTPLLRNRVCQPQHQARMQEAEPKQCQPLYRSKQIPKKRCKNNLYCRRNHKAAKRKSPRFQWLLGLVLSIRYKHSLLLKR